MTETTRLWAKLDLVRHPELGVWRDQFGRDWIKNGEPFPFGYELRNVEAQSDGEKLIGLKRSTMQ